jgi:hypothetical protein
MYSDPEGNFCLLALGISIGLSLLFEVAEDAMDGNGWDHDWKDYLGAGISGFFGGLGGGIFAQIAFSFSGGLADAWLSGDLQQNGILNTLGSIALSSGISMGLGSLSKWGASKIQSNSLFKMTNNQANGVLSMMGSTMKIGSNIAKKTRNGLAKELFSNASNWAWGIVADKSAGTLSGNFSNYLLSSYLLH